MSSSHGKIPRPAKGSSAPLRPLCYPLASSNSKQKRKFLVVLPISSSAALPASLVKHMCRLFNDSITEGRTYPQENELSTEEFEAYYLAYDVCLGFFSSTCPSSAIRLASTDHDDTAMEIPIGKETSFLIPEKLKAAFGEETDSWDECFAGMYYIKPNYPGRSSHCCNAGFVVASRHRGLSVGLTLGKSYLRLAPQLGYKASVFNLVYANNNASLKIWDRLGFTRAGLIPKAGRLKKENGEEEEYVDSVLYWREF